MKKPRPGELEAYYFDKLPQRCKEMFFEFLNMDDVEDEDKVTFFRVAYWEYPNSESPIETILDFAFDLLTFSDRDKKTEWLFLNSQYEVEAEGKKYRIDLMFDSEECENPHVKYSPYKLAIECDGHDFHEKTKEQVRKRNQRDMNLKKSGIDVTHFSGSQIYNDPFGCAKELIDYIKLNLSIVGGNNDGERVDKASPKNP